MATIQDIFDWLNQGAEGDIPGTGQQGATASASADQALAAVQPQVFPAPSTVAEGEQADYASQAAWKARASGPSGPPPPQSSTEPSAQQAGEKGYQAGQKAGQGLWSMLFGKQPQKTPGDYAGDIPPTLLMDYQSLISQGIPPAVAHSILTQPSTGEGENPSGPQWPQNYRGWQQDQNDEIANWGKVPLEQHMRDVRGTQEENLPTWESNTPGDDDNLGFLRLPTGQYVPTSPSAQPSDLLSWYQSQGNPQSFWWNPAQGSGWDSLLGGQ